MKDLVILATLLAVLGLYALALMPPPLICQAITQNAMKCDPAR